MFGNCFFFFFFFFVSSPKKLFVTQKKYNTIFFFFQSQNTKEIENKCLLVFKIKILRDTTIKAHTWVQISFSLSLMRDYKLKESLPKTISLTKNYSYIIFLSHLNFKRKEAYYYSMNALVWLHTTMGGETLEAFLFMSFTPSMKQPFIKQA